MLISNNEIPERFRKDFDTAISILKKYDATEIYLYGSLVDGSYNDMSDIDIAVKGLKPELYFKAWAELSFSIEKKIDLLNMDTQKGFADMLRAHKELVRVA
jgi:predicted nucleotidyltransferase